MFVIVEKIIQKSKNEKKNRHPFLQNSRNEKRSKKENSIKSCIKKSIKPIKRNSITVWSVFFAKYWLNAKVAICCFFFGPQRNTELKSVRISPVPIYDKFNREKKIMNKKENTAIHKFTDLKLHHKQSHSLGLHTLPYIFISFGCVLSPNVISCAEISYSLSSKETLEK